MTDAQIAPDPTRALTKSAFALHLNTVVTSALGFGFLVLAARLYDEATLGRDLALVSAMMLLAAVSELNFGLALPKLLPQLGARSPRAIVLSYLSSSVLALVLAFGFVEIAPRVSNSLAFVGDELFLGLVFCIAVVLWNIFAVQDAVLVALRRAMWVPIENGIFGVAKIVLMVVWASSSIEHGVFYAWALPMMLMVLPITWVLFRVALPQHIATAPEARIELQDRQARKEIYRYLGLDYVASLFVQASTTLLPIIIVVILGAEANAIFGIAFTITTAVEQLALNVGISLTVEGSFDRTVLRQLVRHSLFRFGAMLVPLVLGATLLAPVMLWFFGAEYAREGATVLRLLLLGTIPLSVLILYQALERVRGNTGRIVAMSVARTTVTLAAVIALAPAFGLAGAGWGWLIANVVLALTVVPVFWRVLSGK